MNNYEDLDEVEITDRNSFIDSLTNTNRIYENKIKVHKGNFKTFDQFPVNLDFYWILGKDARLGMYNYYRAKITNGKLTNGIGAGIYLLKNGNPFSSIAGIVFEINDLSKLKDGFDKNFAVNFLIGYNFGN